MVDPPPRTTRATRRERRDRLAGVSLYVCLGPRPDLATLSRAVLAGGAGAVQYRDKNGEWADQRDGLATLAGAIAEFSPGAAVAPLLAANDRADVARLAGTDLLHLGQRDLRPCLARRITGPDLLIGVSTHDLEQAQTAADDPEVDYFCVGPVWATPTKPGRPATGLELLAAVARVAPAKPWFAIGGVDLDRIADIRNAGASRVVVVRAVVDAADPTAAAAAFRHALSS